MKTRSLKRCPFCNSHKLQIYYPEFTHYVGCLECGATGPNGNTLGMAVALWNGEHQYQNQSALVRDRQSNRDDKKEIEI